MTAPTAAIPVPASGRAIAALVLGLLGLLMCQLLSPIAWILGWLELRDIRIGLAPASGRDLATVGMVLGIVGSALLALAALVVVMVAGIVIAALATAGTILR